MNRVWFKNNLIVMHILWKIYKICFNRRYIAVEMNAMGRFVILETVHSKAALV